MVKIERANEISKNVKVLNINYVSIFMIIYAMEVCDVSSLSVYVTETMIGKIEIGYLKIVEVEKIVSLEI